MSIFNNTLTNRQCWTSVKMRFSLFDHFHFSFVEQITFIDCVMLNRRCFAHELNLPFWSKQWWIIVFQVVTSKLQCYIVMREKLMEDYSIRKEHPKYEYSGKRSIKGTWLNLLHLSFLHYCYVHEPNLH